MTQQMEGDHRGLSSPVTPHALISVCLPTVPSVDEISAPGALPWAGISACGGPR